MIDETSNRPAGAINEKCRCLRPLAPPNGPHWWPYRDPEPGPDVRVVVLYGDEPSFLRMVRAPGRWHALMHMVAAMHPELSPSEPWPEIGRCWAGVQHPVVDATHLSGVPADRWSSAGTPRPGR